MRSLTNKSLLWFVGCTVVILLICTPLFYFLTRYFYAEEMVDMIESIKDGTEIQPSDLEEDIMAGMMIQFALIVVVLSIASVVTMRLVSRRLWTPFYNTMQKVKHYNLDKEIPQFTATDVPEFATLNRTLSELMNRNHNTFIGQKEFTQNASHELQTPLAVIQSKLDLLLQEDLNERQMNLVQDMYAAGSRMALLNRNLLLLAKIDNNQYGIDEVVDMHRLLTENIAVCENLYNQVNIACEISNPCLIKANSGLVEIMANNLLVNAVRNTSKDGGIRIYCSSERFEIVNTTTGGSLDEAHLFDRFNHSCDTANRGNGIGLSLVKAVCSYHGWSIHYSFADREHHFLVTFDKGIAL